MKQGTSKTNWILENAVRMDASYHLSEGRQAKILLENSPYQIDALSNVTSDVFMGPRFKRYYVDSEAHGVPFMGGADMQKADLSNLKLISKKMTHAIDQLYLKKGWTLITRSGTIGQTVFTNADFENKTATEDVIRVIANPVKIKPGFLHAFLASKYGYALLTQSTYGAVIQHIEPHHIADLPIPLFPPDQQQHIHDLVVQAAELRVEGNRQIQFLRNELSNKLKKIAGIKDLNGVKCRTIPIQEIIKNESRFDGAYNAEEGRLLYNKIKNIDHIEISSIAEVFHPILFGKKQLKGSSTKGEPMYKSSSMMKLYPETDFWLSLRMRDRYAKLQVKEGWVLVSRTGTVGNVVRISNKWSGIYIDDHMIRIIPQEQFSGLLYLYLTMPLGKSLITFQKYGTVQDVINSEYISRIPIPKDFLNDDFVKIIQVEVQSAFQKIDAASEKERQAITLIETEIASWQS